MNEEKKRIVWIDTAKGIGILLVVAGHVLDAPSRYIFWFHIPLFFYISGYLFNSNSLTSKYLKRKAAHLLIPYFSFLFILSIPDYIVCFNSVTSSNSTFISNSIALTGKLIYGGRDLYGWFDVFWFMTCLFLTQILFHFITRFTGKKLYPLIICTIFLYTFASISVYISYLKIPSIWSINIVPMATVFFFSGYGFKKINMNHQVIIVIAYGILLVAILLDVIGFIDHRFDMKWDGYGLPILNIILALSGITAVCHIAKMISRNKYLSVALIELGKASMIIMFLHQTVRQLVFSRFPQIQNEIIVIVVTTLICYLTYYMLSIHSYSRLLFLGENRKRKMYN